MKQEYDFSNGIRGKYYKRYKSGSNVVVLEPEVAEVFKTSKAVNEALKTLLRIKEYKKKKVKTRNRA